MNIWQLFNEYGWIYLGVHQVAFRAFHGRFEIYGRCLKQKELFERLKRIKLK